jgi:trimeric autotransporter adhesin
MSTKTLRKRIALVAVSALGFGLMSVAPSSAAIGDFTGIAISNTSTIDVDASGATYSAQAVDGTATTTNAPGFAVTAGVVANSISALTVPAGTAIVFKLVASGGTANGNIGTDDDHVLSVNNQFISQTSAGAAAGSLDITYTAPATAGTYAVKITSYRTAGSVSAATLIAENSLTLTVGSAATGLPEFGNATATTALHVASVGIIKVGPSGRVGTPVSFATSFTPRNGTANAVNTNTAAARLAYTLTLPAGTAGSIVNAASAGTAVTNETVSGRNNSLGATTTDATATIGSTRFFIPATAGTYTVTAWHDQVRDGLVGLGEASTTATFVVVADAQPSITFTKFGSNPTAAQSADGQDGQLVRISLRNGTNPWQLASTESLVLTSAASTTDFLAHTTWTQGAPTFTDVASGVSTLTLTSSNFNGDGDAWINVGDTTSAGGTFSVSAVINGGTANGASGSFTITTVDTSAAGYALVDNHAGGVSNPNAGLGVSGSSMAAGGANNVTWQVKLGVATAVSARMTAGANNYKLYNGVVTDTLGLITGVRGGKYNVNAVTPTTGAVATTTVSLGVTIPATTAALPSGTTVATMVVDKDTNGTITITANSSTITSVAVDPSDWVTTSYAIRAAVASSNTFTAEVVDQFGYAVAGAAVTAQVTAGRNAQLVATPLVSDANGFVKFTVADTSTSALLNSDTLKFISNAQEGVVTINYAAYNPASKVTITGGASADVAPTVTLSQISTAVAGASASTALVKMTATVTDANGATLPAGIPVTWAISGLTGKSAILVDATTGYNWATSMTDSNGQAITYVYAWGTGTVSVTATAGTATSATAGKINFANAAADARVVSATANANGVITAKVVDRYGNAVSGVSLTATRTAGTGYFGGNAASSTSGSTGVDGTVDFIVVAGEATVTIATTTLNAGQTSSASGFVGATAVTATGIGASLAPAGVQSVSVTVAGNTSTQDAATAAADAAAEATDAANAATDAANAAAEAADAATAAAQDAADAVAALATSVEAMVNALKRQITSLTNLVIKIQKKVRA